MGLGPLAALTLLLLLLLPAAWDSLLLLLLLLLPAAWDSLLLLLLLLPAAWDSLLLLLAAGTLGAEGHVPQGLWTVVTISPANE